MHQGRLADGCRPGLAPAAPRSRRRGRPAVSSTHHSTAREAAGAAALLLAAAAILGVNYVMLKWALRGAGPLTVALFRAAFGSGTMLAVCAATRTSLRIPWRRDELAAMLVPAAAMGISQLAFILGVKNTGAGLASILSNSMPVFSALLAWAVVRERPSRPALVGIVIAVAGVAVAATVASGGHSTRPLGVLMMLLAVLTWASSNVALKRRRPAGGEIAFATWMLLVGSVVFTPLSGAVEGWEMHFSWKLALESLYSGGVAQIGFLLTLLVLRRGSVTRAGSVSFLVPVFAVGAGALLLHEAVRWQELAGGALIFCGVGLVVFGGLLRRGRRARG